MKRRRFVEAAPVLGATVLAGCTTGLLGDGNASKTDESTPTGPGVRWSYDPGDGVTQVPADQVARDGEYVYVGVDGEVRALDAEAGTEVASSERSKYADRVEVWVVGETLLTLSGMGELAAFDPGLGGPRWKTAGLYVSDPSPDDNLVVMREPGYASVALEDGSVRWRVPDPGPTAGLLDWTDDLALVVDTVEGVVKLWAYERASGEQRWSARRPYVEENPSTATDDGTLYASGWSEPGGRLVAVDLATGESRWDTEYEADPTGVFGRFGDAVVAAVGRDETELRGFDPETGEQRWSEAPADFVVPVGDWLVTGGEGPDFVARNADGSTRWTFTAANGETPTDADAVKDAAIVGEELLVLYDGHLHGLDPADGTERWHYDHGDRIHLLDASGDGAIVADDGRVLNVGGG